MDATRRRHSITMRCLDREGLIVLVLGIETATPQVGVAIGGHEGVLASFHSARDRRLGFRIDS